MLLLGFSIWEKWLQTQCFMDTLGKVVVFVMRILENAVKESHLWVITCGELTAKCFIDGYLGKFQ